jgi:hypothetical protein
MMVTAVVSWQRSRDDVVVVVVGCDDGATLVVVDPGGDVVRRRCMSSSPSVGDEGDGGHRDVPGLSPPALLLPRLLHLVSLAPPRHLSPTAH